ncbi:MAG: chemotaxis protein CheA [Cyanobacteria bacterium]|nr:chemotaxis protein CheA [Cyanobacteriota bacterium]
MALLDPSTELLLQQIATELAFVQVDSASVRALAVALQALKKPTPDQLPDAVRSLLEDLLSWLDQQLCGPSGLDDGQCQELLERYSHLEKALYDGAVQAISRQQPRADDAQLKLPAPIPAPNSESSDAREEASLILAAGDDLELLNEFCNEGRDLLAQIEQSLLILEENPEHRDTLNQVFRAFHTFKGGAGFLGLIPIKDLAHILESLLDAARKGELAITSTVIELILAGGDSLRQFVDRIEQDIRSDFPGQPICVPTRQLIWRVEACLAGQPDPIPQVGSAPLSGPAPAINSSGSAVAQPPAAKAPRNAVEGLPNFVKIDTRKLDFLVELVGELVIAQSMVVEHPGIEMLKRDQLARPLRQLSRITSDLQRNAMSLRMVPIRSTFQKMNRLVRDLAAAQGKQIQLLLTGEETELDRNIVEALNEPLIHLLRNAADHGIGNAEQRAAMGKSPQGTIQLQAGYQGGGIAISIQDDGKGIDPDKILKRAIEKQLVPADFNGTRQDMLSLIFLPGFSTAETLTDISGRGVGLDAVRGSIARLRGRVEIVSLQGQGTTFTIHLPLTLAIIDGMIVAVGDQRFILPTLAIHESFRPQRSMLSTVKGKGQLVNVRGRLIPLLQLSRRLGLSQDHLDPCEGIVVVIDCCGQLLGVLVNGLIAKQEVVIKGMGAAFEQQPFFSGAAIMGDGRVTLILDPDALGRADPRPGLAAADSSPFTA